METPWAVTHEKVEAALKQIVEISKPRKLILFGSYVAGTVKRDSDLDVLVVTGDDVVNPRKESIRIRRALKGVSMSMDILVVSERVLNACADAPGLIYREALRTGRVVYESAA